ncbi:hypothetical protein [Proteiniborus sp. MB09-C3]|uniref:hypothetical protein n=1 Tax=Proteiniborus sp. MB09-C3 TaxID=3050072 RepID=UPI002557B74F|nr:hypothetical protein [Proteiniborus sp. MB09-C3]WIV13369.1 hypothetical protein QO263_06590 [Proteiniborus sp. MB09-C3]
MIQKIRNNPYVVAMYVRLKEERLFKIDYFSMTLQLIVQSLIYFLFFSSFLHSASVDWREVVIYYVSINFIFISVEEAMYFAYELMTDIKDGIVSLFETKPVSYVKYRYFQKTGKTIFVLAINIVFMGILRYIIFKEIFILDLMLVLVSSFIGFSILFFIQGIIGCFTRYFIDITRFRDVIYMVLLVFGGKVLPISMMPKTLANMIEYTPIPYIFNTPAEIFVGHYSISTIGIQLVWAIVLGLFFNTLYKAWIKENVENFS